MSTPNTQSTPASDSTVSPSIAQLPPLGKRLAQGGIFLLMLTVLLGAFGAHALKGYGDLRLGWWKTAVDYQRMHGFGLLILALLSPYIQNQVHLKRIGVCFIIGWFFFSGSLYALTLTEIRVLGAITPIGGTLWILGWAGLFGLKWDLQKTSSTP